MGSDVFKTYDSFAELGRDYIQPEIVVTEAWEAIRSYCTGLLHGSGRKLQPQEVSEFLDQAIRTLQQKYNSPHDFLSAIAKLELDEQIDRQTLYVFAGRWKKQEETAKHIATNADTVIDAAYTILYPKKTGSTTCTLLTPEELSRQEKRIKQRKKDRRKGDQK